jgi:hypothetical protein
VSNNAERVFEVALAYEANSRATSRSSPLVITRSMANPGGMFRVEARGDGLRPKGRTITATAARSARAQLLTAALARRTSGSLR